MEGLPLRLAAVAAALFLLGPPARALSPEEPRSDAESFYQSGVDLYARGRFAKARLEFEEAVRRDPRHRAARVALERLRVEHSYATKAAPSPAPAPRLSAAGLRAEAWAAPFAALRRVLFFERTVGDAREALGRLEALQGLLSQLETERRVCRARGRAFAREAELRALARRLPEVLS